MSANRSLTQLTEMQADFVRHRLSGASPSQAAGLARYACPETEGWRLMQHPVVLAALEHATRPKIIGDILPMALSGLEAMLKDKTLLPSVRVKVIELGLKTAGIFRHELAEKDPTREKPLSEMTAAELTAKLARIDQSLAAIDAKTVDAVAETHITDVPTAEGLGLS